MEINDEIYISREFLLSGLGINQSFYNIQSHQFKKKMQKIKVKTITPNQRKKRKKLVGSKTQAKPMGLAGLKRLKPYQP
jgi:hypothetical protein